jgi:hypothetical protein
MVAFNHWMFVLNLPLTLPRRAEPAFRPFALALLLLALLLLQLLLPQEASFPEVGARVPRQLAAVEVQPLPAYAAILQRPLFVPGRRMEADSAPEAAAIAVTASIARHAVVGVVRGNGGARAFLKMPDGNTRTLRPGDSLDGWQLAAITPAGALFRKESESITLPVQPSNAPPLAAVQTSSSETPAEEENQ